VKKERFEERKQQLESLSDEELNTLFWRRADQIVDPLAKLAENHTSPSIERSVLLRMGFNSLEAKEIVQGIFDLDLLGKGAGNILLTLSKELDKDYLQVGKEMIEGKHWKTVEKIFKGVE